MTTTADIAEIAAAFLLFAALIAVGTGCIAAFLLIRGRFRRDLPRRKPRARPPTPDPWTEAGRRLSPDTDDDGRNDDAGDDDDRDDDDPPPKPKHPPALSARG